MENTRFTAEFCKKTVLGFCRFPENALSALALDLSLTLSKAELLHCQQYFRAEAMRDPTVGELRFIAALAVRMRELPAAITLNSLSFSDETDARIFADIMRQRKALGKAAALTPADLLQTATAYLARAGRRIVKEPRRLHVGEDAYITALNKRTVLTLKQDGVGATILPPIAKKPRKTGDCLLALSAKNGQNLADATKSFFEKFKSHSSAPFALIGTEGIAAHLATLPMAAELDLMPLADFDAASGAPSLIDACKHTLLFSCPQAEAMALLQQGAPITLVGRFTGGDIISVRYGIQPILSLSRKFLASLCTIRPTEITVPARERKLLSDEASVCEDEQTLLCGIQLNGAPEASLCKLLIAAFEQGAVMTTARLGAVLSLPLAAKESAIADAVGLILPLHRFASELALSTEVLRVVTAPTGEPPRLTVFLTTAKGAVCKDENDLKTAIYKGDFATVRTHIYQQVAQK